MNDAEKRTRILPRVFQANLSRFFDRVIGPGMDALSTHETLLLGETDDLDEFLDRAANQVDNHTANEAAKAFTLVLAGLFERQLSLFTRSIQEAKSIPGVEGARYERLLELCAAHAGIDLGADPIGKDLVQLLVVANVVRHGEGRACERLRIIAPELWDENARPSNDYVDLSPGPTPPSERLRIRRGDLLRYAYATTRFWGLSDPLDLPEIDPPYRTWGVYRGQA